MVAPRLESHFSALVNTLSLVNPPPLSRKHFRLPRSLSLSSSLKLSHY